MFLIKSTHCDWCTWDNLFKEITLNFMFILRPTLKIKLDKRKDTPRFIDVSSISSRGLYISNLIFTNYFFKAENYSLKVMTMIYST